MSYQSKISSLRKLDRQLTALKTLISDNEFKGITRRSETALSEVLESIQTSRDSLHRNAIYALRLNSEFTQEEADEHLRAIIRTVKFEIDSTKKRIEEIFELPARSL